MIAKIEGQISYVGNRFLIVDVSGVGYKLFVTNEAISLSKVEESIKLWVHTAVRENSIDLYGFLDIEELSFFELLLDVSGIGPKSALSTLSVAPVSTLRKAIASGDTTYLNKVSGIGRKTAEKIIIELKDKLKEYEGDIATSQVMQEERDILEALRTLGYSQDEAREAIKRIPADMTEMNNRLKEALKIIGRR
ncbi:MAG TPA: Holliday junction branch migration protein RuvA [Candidatus Paceibacterota bacterium]|nr:Holliday junction branch migration protein RuvA [Candidatus Paceibacterota bacterium]HPI82642.1 Holliday junction branch migration protein RuvA [Candidatus Paceibacterota bacterium]HPR84217.1 Holliday junction branch migration protein RuvA [Candidatus Paceibacterota bacterium]